MPTQPLASLVLQNAGGEAQIGLLEAILQSCVEADYGAGAFAWANASGLRLVFEDQSFKEFLREGSFDLIIGVDAVTNIRALDVAQDITARNTNLGISVLLHEENALFHPKACWFRRAQGPGVLIVGSGNMTFGGLRANWEAFTMSRLSKPQMDAVEHQWNEWRRRHESLLLTTRDERARARAERNVGWEGAARRPVVVAPPSGLDEQTALAAETSGDLDAEALDESNVLVAVIPRAGDRWQQANFDLKTYEGYFRASVGAQRRILLQHVGASGAVSEPTSTPSVEVKSRNFRFELSEAPRVPYPNNGRPIAVFVRLPGVFRYHLLMPGESGHGELEALLARTWTGRSDRMPRIEIVGRELREAWPDAPFWRALGSA